ncbi:hypothetical protein [Sphingomonas sp. BK069]|uniref:hypothetical protein n=1 Tax=Sphingomonas sp. BK069 TaxID=2586979 RepID=UPI0016072C9C|nr:hypothetical protein [Sphingomonas sp. BK069]MBB3345808.1 hypothetical protein [Sphingomonas sp. BK069]
MSTGEDDRSDGPGAMYDAARAALLGTARGEPPRQKTRGSAADALARLGEPATHPDEVTGGVTQPRDGEQEKRA